MIAYIFTRDLRLQDNPVLRAICNDPGFDPEVGIIPVFVLNTDQITQKNGSASAISLMLARVAHLHLNIIRDINELHKHGVKTLYMMYDYTPYARKRAETYTNSGFRVIEVHDLLLGHTTDELIGKTYQKFSKFEEQFSARVQQPIKNVSVKFIMLPPTNPELIPETQKIHPESSLETQKTHPESDPEVKKTTPESEKSTQNPGSGDTSETKKTTPEPIPDTQKTSPEPSSETRKTTPEPSSETRKTTPEPIPDTQKTSPEPTPGAKNPGSGSTFPHEIPDWVGKHGDCEALYNNESGSTGNKYSPYLKFGIIGVRELNFATKRTLTRSLLWRDFYYNVSMIDPGLLRNTFHKWTPGLNYSDPFLGEDLHSDYVDKYSAWCSGKTGIQIVDACMNQLNSEHYLHNRGRLIVADCLINKLGIPWRWGEYYFQRQLADYDPIINNYNWQFMLGTGPSAKPPYTKYNLQKQQNKFDPDGLYVAKYERV